MNKRTDRSSFAAVLIPLLVLAMTSCRGVGGLIKQPLDKIDGDRANGERVIDADLETVVSAARGSITDAGLELIKDRELPDGGRMLVGKAPMSMWSNGGFARVVVLESGDASGVTVRVLTLTKSAMNVTANWNYAPKIFAALDRRLARAPSRKTAASEVAFASGRDANFSIAGPSVLEPIVRAGPARSRSTPTRRFDDYGVRFRYPREFTLECDDESENVEIFSMEGSDTLVMLQAYDERVFEGKPPSAVLDLIADLTAKKFEGFGVDREELELELNGEIYDCRRLTVTIGGVRIRQEFVALDLRGASGVLMLQGVLDDSGAYEPECVEAFGIIADTLELAG